MQHIFMLLERLKQKKKVERGPSKDVLTQFYMTIGVLVYPDLSLAARLLPVGTAHITTETPGGRKHGLENFINWTCLKMNLEPRNPKKKCIADDCEDCHFFRYWNLIDEKGNAVPKKVCSQDVAFQAIPKLIGSIDGCQEATNETRNTVFKFGQASQDALDTIADGLNQINKTELIENADS